MFLIGVIVALCYVPGITGTYIATQWPLLGVFVCFWFLRSGRFTPFHAAGVAFFAYATWNAFLSPLPDVGMWGLLVLFVACGSVWLGTTLEDPHDLLSGLAFGAGISSLLAVGQALGYVKLFQAADAYAGLYVNGAQQGAVLALVAVALASRGMWLHILPLVPGIALAHSRGAWLALAIGLLACRYRRVWVFAALALAGAPIALNSLSGSDTERLQIWSFAWAHLNWLGNGTGVFNAIMLPRPDGTPFFPEYAHNDVLQFAFEQGVAVALPIAVIGYAVSRTDAPEWPAVVAFVALTLYTMPLYMPVAAFLGMVCMGRALRRYGSVRGARRDRRPHVGQRWQHSIRTAFEHVKVDRSRARVPVQSHNAIEG